MTTAEQHRLDFTRWLRTGRWVPAQLDDPRLEVKFNPNHDPANGQFTFGTGGESAGDARDGQRRTAPGNARPSTDPRNPNNYRLHRVKPGETLQHVAATRVGLTPADLRWLNDMKDDRLTVGQQIKVPTQESLDAGKRAFDTFVALDTYMSHHGGRLPPNVAHPPSLGQQVYGEGTTHIEKKGYAYDIDPQGRTRLVSGTIRLNANQKRSTRNQISAGGADRLPGDHGGHYIARRFDGPTDAFNHFAQDASFNRRQYAAIENGWAAATKRGEKVRVVIVPEYIGKSTRPSHLRVSWTIGGFGERMRIANGSKAS